MNITHKLFAFCITGFMLFSCSGATDTEVEVEEEDLMESELIEEEDHDDHHHGDAHGDIILLDGNKWDINDEMKPHVEEGEALLTAYIESGDENYLGLAAELKEANTKLIKSCTMQGQSHDELHKWLHPHLDLTTHLEEAGNIEEAENIIDELVESYENFHLHFN